MYGRLLVCWLLVAMIGSLQAVSDDCEYCNCHGSWYDDVCHCYTQGWNGPLCNQCQNGRFSISYLDEKCAGQGGYLLITTSSAPTPWKYSITGKSNANTTSSYTSLRPGSYNTWAFGTLGSENCIIPYNYSTQTAPFRINAATPITIGYSSVPSGCAYVVTVTASGGKGNLAYSLDNVNYQQSNVFRDISGVQNLYVRDDNNCVSSKNVDLGGTAIVMSCTPTAPSCNGGLGSVTITASGGSGNYAYSVDGVVYHASKTFDLPKGDYSCWVKDGNCTYSNAFMVGGGPPAIALTPTTTDETCQGRGSISLIATGGTGGFFYSLDNATWTNTTQYPVPAGNYAVYAKDSNNCIVSSSVVVRASPGILVSLVIGNGTCTLPGGSVVFNGSNLTSYLLSFNGGSYESNKWRFSGLTAGIYTYSIMDMTTNCMMNSSFTVFQETVANACAVNNCHAKATCTNVGLCGFNCTCIPGYKGNGVSCVDIDECMDGSNGGCDIRVNCTNTQGNRTCAICPNGTIGDGFTCKSACGNGICDVYENCVTCFRDCNTSTCNLCGDGYCNSTIGEKCDNCHEDCGHCPDRTCTGGCGIHGACDGGACSCTSSWTGPTCSTPPTSVNVTANGTAPIVTIDPTSSTTRFFISIKNISEINSNGDIVRSYSLTSTTFKLNETHTGLNVKYNYSAALPNRALVNVILQQFEENATTVSYANTNTTFPAHTLKLNFLIQQWPFMQLANRLSITIDSSAAHNGTSFADECRSDERDASGNLRWMLIVVGNTSLYGKFLDKAVIDGRIRAVVYNLNADDTVSAIIPSFWEYADMDPQFNVLVGDETSKQCGKSIRNPTAGVNKTLIAIIVPTVVGGMILIALAVVFAPKAKTWWQLNHTKSVQELEADEFKVDSYRPNMQTNTAAGEFTVKFNG